jgi:hypothetical protein
MRRSANHGQGGAAISAGRNRQKREIATTFVVAGEPATHDVPFTRNGLGNPCQQWKAPCKGRLPLHLPKAHPTEPGAGSIAKAHGE